MTPVVNVVLLDFKEHRGREMVTENEDGSFTILVNSRLSYEGQLAAYQHAMRHIEQNDFEKQDVQAIEAVAHQLPTAERMPPERYLAMIKRSRRQRKRLEKKLKEIEADMKFLNRSQETMFEIAEDHHLYGGI